MLNTGYLYAKDSNRIFINTSLGCKSNCTYCYLPKIGYKNNTKDFEVKSADEILSDINNSGYKLNDKTIITLGCFSECWDEENKIQTIELIKYFLKQGNQVQLATKKEITLDEAMKFKDLIKYNGQLIIYVSSATISQWDSIEKIQIVQKNVLKHLIFLVV